MLIVNKLTKYYGAELILKDLSFSIGEKDHLAIVGNNGAGKTTLLKAIANETDHEGNSELVGGFKNISGLKQEIDEKFLEDTVFEFIRFGAPYIPSFPVFFPWEASHTEGYGLRMGQV